MNNEQTRGLEALNKAHNRATRAIKDAKQGQEINFLLCTMICDGKTGDMQSDTDTSGRPESLLVGTVNCVIDLIMEYPDDYRLRLALRVQAMISESVRRQRKGNKEIPTVQEIDSIVERTLATLGQQPCPDTKLH
ncbi:hypothetical protein [Acetobacter senegalensis]|uniref:hypothetical protein n=1 Tax=Acetobacter senegalensis TaxID=446692 RepID=UPI00128CD7A4|nr:hypothetical protein [Acetobacter senegalensis]MPQ75268.1 hypothetical protein [Acetobacter senegalensis]